MAYQPYDQPIGQLVGGDFNGDGTEDLLVANASSMSVYSTISFVPLLGKGDGTFTPGTLLELPNATYVEYLDTADVNGDGILDFVINYSGNGNLFLGTGTGTFTNGGPTTIEGAVAFADFNGDGLEDMLDLGPSGPAGTQSGTVLLSATQGSVATVSGVALTPTGAPHAVVASYQGDSAHAPSESSPAVLPAQTALTLATTANSVLYGQPFTLTATLSPYTGAGGSTNGEAVTFYYGNVTLGTGTLSGGVATLTVSTLAVGEYSIFAAYSGDAGFATSDSNLVPVQVAAAQATLQLTSTLSSTTYGTPVTLTATLNPSTYAGVNSDGTAIKFLLSGVSTFATATLSSGVAQLTTTNLPAGVDQVTAVFPGDSTIATVTSPAITVTEAQAPLTVIGPTLLRAYGVPNPPLTGTVTGAVNSDQFTVSGTTTATLTSPPGVYPIVPVASGFDLGNYTVTTVNGTLTVTQPLPTISAVTASSNPAMAGAAVTFTVSVTSENGTPTGTVTFLDGTTTLGMGTLGAGGTATYSTSSLAAGTHSITASYSGDTNFGAVTSAVLSEVIESFSVGGSSGGSTTQTVSPGGTATYALSVTPPTVGNPITFSVTGLPTGATATFTPSTVAVGAGPTNVSLVVTVPSTAGAASATNLVGNGVLPISLGLILLPFAGRLRKGSRRWLWVVVLGLAGLGAMGACGGGGNSSGGGGGNTPQNYTLTVTATSGTLTQTTTLTLTVN